MTLHYQIKKSIHIAYRYTAWISMVLIVSYFFRVIEAGLAEDPAIKTIICNGGVSFDDFFKYFGFSFSVMFILTYCCRVIKYMLDAPKASEWESFNRYALRNTMLYVMDFFISIFVLALVYAKPFVRFGQMDLSGFQYIAFCISFFLGNWAVCSIINLLLHSLVDLDELKEDFYYCLYCHEQLTRPLKWVVELINK